ncbi:MAG: NAD(P)/FAD-dependent oxidoreductase [Acidobacteria bacterium]|nr:NAD(P)/FAD-dependent oxidoreductase [Acidobacteriota bacterium]
MAEGLLVIGAGPAGLAAALAASDAGMAVTLVDAQPEPGGQIWRGQWSGEARGAARAIFADLRRSAVTLRLERRVIAAPKPGCISVCGPSGPEQLPYDRLVLATGARERFLPFPGWTLPGVLGAGGLQALVKDGLDVRGRRVVVGGSGPLLLAVAAHLRAKGAHVLAVAEQAPRHALWGLAPELLRRPRLLTQGLGFLGLPLRHDAWVTRAEGDAQLRRIHFRTPSGTQVVEADLLAVGFGLISNLELPMLLGCACEGGRVTIDAAQRTSLPHVFAAGEPTGVGGVEKALAEGRVAGLMAAGREAEAARFAPEAERGRAWARALETAFAQRPELRELPEPSTILCRCEDVPVGEVQSLERGRDARLHARCGMGRCQGRTCGPAAEFLFGWAPGGPRLPLVPTTFADLVGGLSDPEQP